MEKKIQETKIISILILMFIFILIIMYAISQAKDLPFQDDLIFFKFWNSPKQKIENSEKKSMLETKQYEMKVSKNIPSYQKISLFQTVDQKTLVREKIAPGTKGNFEIILTANSTLHYKIERKDQNLKPQNFQIIFQEGTEGEIQEKESKKIRVDWEWQYETSVNQNFQDTKDGETIETYNFEIWVKGE